jgi:type IV pilus assembly protein PilV
MKKITTNNKGFTLIELAIAIVIFSIGLLAMAQLQMFSIRYNSDAQRMSEATTLAQGKMEELMSSTYAAMSSVPQDAIADDNYDTSYTITADSPSPLTGVSELEVTVKWSSRGNDKTFTLNTIRAELEEE